MNRTCDWRALSLLLLFVFNSCSNDNSHNQDLINGEFPEAQAELRDVIDSIVEDAAAANIEGLQAVHLASDKFSKFGPRRFDRQNLESTNESEAAFFSSVSDYVQEIKDLKIDVFGDIAVATYHPQVSFVRDGVEKSVSGRQTFVFLKTKDGWKIVHEHGTTNIGF